MAETAKKHNYKGILVKPIETDLPFAGYKPDPKSIFDRLLSPDYNAEVRKLNSQLELRWAALFKEFCIDPSDENKWKDLAHLLVLAHVPGFRVKYRHDKKAGASTKWGPLDKLEFFYRVEKLKRGGKTTSSACVILSKDIIYKKTNKDAHSLKATLERRYREISKSTREKVSNEEIDDFLKAAAARRLLMR